MSSGTRGVGLGRLKALARRRRLAALGIALAAAMAGAALTVGISLGQGFDRAAARADLPDVIARFDAHDLAEVDRRVASLPNVAARSYRQEIRHVALRFGAHSTDRGLVQLLEPGRRGYAIVAGRDLAPTAGDPADTVIERGLADAWGLRPGDRLELGGFSGRVVGVAVSPDGVAFPLSSSPQVFLSGPAVRRAYGPSGAIRVNRLELWVRDRSRLAVTLAQARETDAGLRDLRFLTRDGIRSVLDHAAGIVIALLVAFSLAVLASALVMLVASAQADVQRRLGVLGILRALGRERGALVRAEALDAALLAAPAGALGLAAGATLAAMPSGRLLAALDEVAPGSALLPWLGAAWAVIVGVSAAASAWPAWRATAYAPAVLLRAGELAAGRSVSRRPARGSPFALGVRAMAARPLRLGLSIVVLATAAAVVLLMLGLSGLLVALRDDPGAVGRRYQLTAQLPAKRAAEVAALPGVARVGVRYQVEAADSFDLGESLELVAYPSDHTPFEAPPLVSGRRASARDEVEVGRGLADALGVGPGGVLAAQVPGGREVRLRVVGVVDALDNDGRVAFGRSAALLAADPGLAPTLAIVLRPGASTDTVTDGVAALGGAPQRAAAATSSDGGFLSTLAAVLRVVAGIDGIVCLYALVAVLGLVARERAGTIALLRALGGGSRAVGALLTGACGVVVLAAGPLAVVLEGQVFAPLVGHLAADYTDLPVAASAGQAALAGLGLVAIAVLAAVAVVLRSGRVPAAAALRELTP